MDMEKKDLKKLSKGQLIKRNQGRLVTMSTCSTMVHLRMKLHKSLQNQGLTNHFKCKMHEDHQNPLESLH